MFLPMSWTSPLTVAVTIVPARRPVPSRCASRYGMSTATAFFITRALLTTCGRNIRPAPNRSPTTFIPAISGPSMTSSGRAAASRASSVSSTMYASMPATRAWVRRSSTGPSRQARSSAARSIPALAGVLRRQVEQPLRGVGPAVEDHVLDPLAELRLDVVVDRQDAGVDDRHVEAGRDGVIEEDRVDRLAHPVVATERERDVRHATRGPRPGELRLQPPDRLDERDGVGVVLLHPGRDGEDVGVEDDVLGLEADRPRSAGRTRAAGRRPAARPIRPGPARRRP